MPVSMRGSPTVALSATRVRNASAERPMVFDVAAGGWRPAASAWSPLGHEPNRNVKGGFIPFNNTATVRSPPAPAEKNRTSGTVYV